MADEFGEWLANEVAERLLTLDDFAAKGEFAISSLRNWISGREKPRRLSRAKLAKALGTSLREINERLDTQPASS